MAHSKEYKFVDKHNYEFMFLSLLGISISLTATAIFIIFYSISDPWRDLLDSLDYMGKITMIFLFTFAFIGSELHQSTYYFPFMFSVGALLVLNLVLVQYDFGRSVSFWISLGIIVMVYAYDFLFYASPKQKKIFYIPIFIELAILGVGYLFYIFQVPERFCPDAKFVQLYLTGFLIFTLFLINFIFEASNILYVTLKLNSGNYDPDEDDFFAIDNIYHKG